VLPLFSIVPTTDNPSHPVRYTRNVQRSGAQCCVIVRVALLYAKAFLSCV